MTIPIPPSLDPQEEQLLADFEAGDLHSVATPDLLAQLQQAAEGHVLYKGGSGCVSGSTPSRSPQ